MSASEIADNRWELSATKPPVTSAAGIAQILLMSGFGLFFVYILIGSIQGMIMPKTESSIAKQFESGNQAASSEAADAAAE